MFVSPKLGCLCSFSGKDGRDDGLSWLFLSRKKHHHRICQQPKVRDPQPKWNELIHHIPWFRHCFETQFGNLTSNWWVFSGLSVIAKHSPIILSVYFFLLVQASFLSSLLPGNRWALLVSSPKMGRYTISRRYSHVHFFVSWYLDILLVDIEENRFLWILKTNGHVHFSLFHMEVFSNRTSPKSSKSLDQSNIETHGDLGIPHFGNPPFTLW